MTRGVVYVNMLLTEQVNPTTHAQRAVEGERQGWGQQGFQEGTWGASRVSFLPQHPEVALSRDKSTQGSASLPAVLKATSLTWLVWG